MKAERKARPRWTPNQIEKRQQLIEAAREVLAHQGLAGTRARAVAKASPLTKSAIHYYFEDLDELIDLAMATHVTNFVIGLKAASAKQADPYKRVWSTIQAYLRTFRETPRITFLWFEYWVDAARKGRLEPINRMHKEVLELLTELLRDTGVDDSARRAHALFSYLLGTVLQETVIPTSAAQLRSDVADICGFDQSLVGEKIEGPAVAPARQRRS